MALSNANNTKGQGHGPMKNNKVGPEPTNTVTTNTINNPNDIDIVIQPDYKDKNLTPKQIMPLSNANAKGPMKNNPLFTKTNKVGPEPTDKTNPVTTDKTNTVTTDKTNTVTTDKTNPVTTEINNPLFTKTNKVGPEPTNTVTTDIDDNITSNNRFKPAATTKKNKREIAVTDIQEDAAKNEADITLIKNEFNKKSIIYNIAAKSADKNAIDIFKNTLTNKTDTLTNKTDTKTCTNIIKIPRDILMELTQIPNLTIT